MKARPSFLKSLKSLKSLTLFISLIALISLTANLFLLQKIRSENLVIEVFDGDTILLKSGKKVRLMGVEAPERENCAGQEAKARLTDLILGKEVVLKEEAPETFGRRQALVYQGRTLVNKVMLEEGWGRIDYTQHTPICSLQIDMLGSYSINRIANSS